MAVEGVELGGTYSVQPPANAGEYLLLNGLEEAGRIRFKSRLLRAGGEHGQEPYARLLPLEEEVQRWLDSPVGVLEIPLPPEGKLEAALCGSRVAELFNRVQLDATGADFSCTSLGKDVYKRQPFESSASGSRKTLQSSFTTIYRRWRASGPPAPVSRCTLTTSGKARSTCSSAG